jgi:phosphoribosylaminoimidazolecarboxamide formyltransferase / IMP cyclohydrolase
MLRPIRRALLSVSDKTGLVDFASELTTQFGVELIATGGTRKALADAGLPVKDIAELTKFPEILDGRVKTLHPSIYAGLLAKRNKPEHMRTLAEHNLPEIDLVVCNLYPFEETVEEPDVTETEAIENIDIGGPCMIRAAAKNFESVTVIVDPVLYDECLQNLKSNDGQLTREYRQQLAFVAFQRIADYDAAIAEYFLGLIPLVDDDDDGNDGNDEDGSEPEWDDEVELFFDLKQSLRYGENPHQNAAFYIEPDLNRPCIASAEQLHGKELSYNNILDLDSALNLVREFPGLAAVVVKHNNPCGAAVASTLTDAFQLAWSGDPQSAFGGILAFNRPVDADTASALMDPKAKRFIECVIAPDYEPHALDALKGWKENVRLLKTGPLSGFPQGFDYRRVDGGLLVQSRDVGADDPDKWKVVTKRKPTEEEFNALWFAWLVCKHVKSNALVLSSGQHVVGVGAGQMSRVDSVQIAIRKAGDRVKGSVLASDAFFPFRDNVDAAAAAGVAAIIQPGGSVKDADSIAACDEHGLAMLFTGVRHFRH